MPTPDYTMLTKADLVKVLETNHGITIKDVSKTSKSELITRLNDLEGISIPQPVGEQSVNELAPKTGDTRKLTGVVINIHKGSTREQQQDVFVGCNGVGYQIRRGENVQVKPAVYEVLKNAVETNYQPEVDPNTRKLVMKPNESLRHPFSVVEKVYN